MQKSQEAPWKDILLVKFYSSEKHVSEAELLSDNIGCWVFLKF